MRENLALKEEGYCRDVKGGGRKAAVLSLRSRIKSHQFCSKEEERGLDTNGGGEQGAKKLYRTWSKERHYDNSL